MMSNMKSTDRNRNTNTNCRDAAAEHSDLCLGIDLGTTNSVASIINVKANGDIVSKVVSVPRAYDAFSAAGTVKLSRRNEPTLPSCVYYREDKDYEPLVGNFARQQYALRPHLVSKSIKSQMGNPAAEGLSPDVPDKTPSDISARILKHLLRETGKMYHCGDLTDAVITVPANFNSAMCEATLIAARKAGIRLKNADGSDRQVLLSEPNAVIYDLVNQIRNGEIPSALLDLKEKKNVIVFDIGGGTLDITFHEIRRREDIPEILRVKEIATNRYTRLGGDDFDELLAGYMFQRYLKQYEDHPEIVRSLKQQKNRIMPQMKNYAEGLKLELSNRYCDDYTGSGWDEEEEDFLAGGSIFATGYAYSDQFTKEEIEEIFDPFMGRNLSFDDYRKIDGIPPSDTGNIIYPVLDVLRKAAEKTGTENVSVDAVVMNGGMSRFYMITERLREFFGFEPIAALDPDQSVARGAAVYHYYLHRYDELKEDKSFSGRNSDESRGFSSHVSAAESVSVPPLGIEWSNSILNDSLYLGLKNGAVQELIRTGTELPYQSEVMTGFRITPGQYMVKIPVKSKDIDGTYRTIAGGRILFRKNYREGAYVSFTVYMNTDKVISVTAWTSSDENGWNRIEECETKIVIGEDSGSEKGGKTILSSAGMRLIPSKEIPHLIQMCRNYEKSHGSKKSEAAGRIAASVSSICGASNKKEFAETILNALAISGDNEARMRLFTLARKIGTEWSSLEKSRLAAACFSQLAAPLQGFGNMQGVSVSVSQQAVLALSVCASREQADRLKALHDEPKLLQSCLYTHARTRTQQRWIYEQFHGDVKKAVKGWHSNLQFSSHAVGVVFRKPELQIKIAGELCDAILSGRLDQHALVCCVMALGLICDQRYESRLKDDCAEAAGRILGQLHFLYPFETEEQCSRMRHISMKMIRGEFLENSEEEYLLQKLDI